MLVPAARVNSHYAKEMVEYAVATIISALIFNFIVCKKNKEGYQCSGHQF